MGADLRGDPPEFTEGQRGRIRQSVKKAETRESCAKALTAQCTTYPFDREEALADCTGGHAPGAADRNAVTNMSSR